MSSKPTLNMIGGGFQHAFSSCGWEHPKEIVWDKTDHSSHISVHIDASVFDIPVDKSKINVAWFCESPFFMRPYTNRLDTPSIKKWLFETYRFVFCSDKEIIKKYPELLYIPPHARPWVEHKEIFTKTKLASIIASGKREAPGHQLRHNIISKYDSFLEVWGSGYRPVSSKNEGLNDYMFSFAIENFQADGYFTEKITDCFSCGTIPIYWGDPTISEHFLAEGIVFLNDDFDGSCLTKEFYESKRSFIKENFTRAINLPIPEDYMYLNYLK